MNIIFLWRKRFFCLIIIEEEQEEKKKRERVRERESKRTEEASTVYSVVLEIENEQYNKNQTTPKYNPIDTSVYFFFRPFLRTSFI
jgi:hypothetical protein